MFIRHFQHSVLLKCLFLFPLLQLGKKVFVGSDNIVIMEVFCDVCITRKTKKRSKVCVQIVAPNFLLHVYSCYLISFPVMIYFYGLLRLTRLSQQYLMQSILVMSPSILVTYCRKECMYITDYCSSYKNEWTTCSKVGTLTLSMQHFVWAKIVSSVMECLENAYHIFYKTYCKYILIHDNHIS